MKNMLDELKKLDEDYKVPENFRKDVMNKIRKIDKENKANSKKKYFIKYVIPSISTAAVILIAIIIGNNINKTNLMSAQATNDIQNDRIINSAIITAKGENNNELSANIEKSPENDIKEENILNEQKNKGDIMPSEASDMYDRYNSSSQFSSDTDSTMMENEGDSQSYGKTENAFESNKLQENSKIQDEIANDDVDDTLPENSENNYLNKIKLIFSLIIFIISEIQ